MPGVFGYFSHCIDLEKMDSIVAVLDLSSNCETRRISTVGGFTAVSWHKHAPPLSSYAYEDDRYLACVCGDLAGLQEVPWEQIIAATARGRYGHFSMYRGNFAFSILDKSRQRIYLASDRFSHYPIYYLRKKDGFIYSSSLPVFCRLDEPPEFNEKWLYEFLYFNYPLGQTTFLKGVYRLGPATILEYDLHGAQLLTSSYADLMRRPSKLLTGKEALEKALAVFSESIPKFYQTRENLALSITAGLDSRTILSFASPDLQNSLATFTYGVDGCNDLRQAAITARQMPFHHVEIKLDGEFLRELPEMLFKVVYLSNGLERVSRATLEYVYRTLTNVGEDFSVIISGVSGDHLFRDHILGNGNVPALISSDMMRSFQKGTPFINGALFRKVFQGTYEAFEEHISGVFSGFQLAYGKLPRPETYMNFLVYETGPKYFGGEAAIVGNYSTFRTPYWDADIVRLAYEIDCSTLGFSEDISRKDRYREKVLQSYIMNESRLLSDDRIDGLPLEVFSANNKKMYIMKRITKGISTKVQSVFNRTPRIRIENWTHWLNTLLREEVENLLSPAAMITSYLNPAFVKFIQTKPVRSNEDVNWLSKCVTAEVILRLIQKKWSL